jgi:uncharacterized protein YciI
MTQFLYKLQATRPGMLSLGPDPREAAVIDDHTEYVDRLLGGGVVLLYGRAVGTGDASFGIAIFRADSHEAARRIVSEDPGVRGGVLRAELQPFQVTRIGTIEATQPADG